MIAKKYLISYWPPISRFTNCITVNFVFGKLAAHTVYTVHTHKVCTDTHYVATAKTLKNLPHIKSELDAVFLVQVILLFSFFQKKRSI